MTNLKTEHTPDRSRIPKALQSLEWIEIDPDWVWEDGTEFLAAVPVCGRDDTWYYEINACVVQCDEEHFRVELTSEEDFSWDIGDVDYIAIFRGRVSPPSEYKELE